MEHDDLKKLCRLQAKQIVELSEELEEASERLDELENVESEEEHDDGSDSLKYRAEVARLESLLAARTDGTETRVLTEKIERLEREVKMKTESLEKKSIEVREANVRAREAADGQRGTQHAYNCLLGDETRAKAVIEKALGKVDGDWLQHACGIIRRRREMGVGEIGGVARDAYTRTQDWGDVAAAVCEFLGVEFVK